MPARAAWSIVLVACLVAPLPAAAPRVRRNAEQQATFLRIDKLNGEVIKLFPSQKYKDALPLAEETLKLSLGLFGPDSRYVAVHRMNLATVKQQLGDLDGALTQMNEAVRIFRFLWAEDDPGYAACLGNLALLYLRKDQYALAMPLAEEALERAARAPAGPVRDNAMLYSLNTLAVLHRMRGEPRRALPLLRRVVESVEARKGKPDPNLAIFLNNLGMVYHEVGETRLALATYDKALRLLEQLQATSTFGYAQSLSNLATIYRDVGEHREAIPLSEKALEIYRKELNPKHSAPALVYNNLAALHEALGEYRRAEECYQNAEGLRAKHRPGDQIEKARYLQGFGVLALKAGDHDRAEKLLREALAAREKPQGATHPEYAKNLCHLAMVHEARGEFGRAASLYDQAARAYLHTTGERYLEHAHCLSRLALAMQAQGYRAAALAVAERALASAHAYVDDAAYALSDRQRQQAIELSDGVLEVYLGLGADLAPPPALFTWVVATKALATRRPGELRVAKDRPELSVLVGELRDTRALLGRHMNELRNAPDLAAWKRRFAALERRKEGLQASLGQAGFDLARPQVRPTAQAVAGGLPEGAALVEFYQYGHPVGPQKGSLGWRREPRLAAFVLPREGDAVLVPLGPAGPIEQAVRRWRESAITPAGPDPGAAALLRRAVWEPVEKRLGAARTVLVAPSGELASLPFAALPGGEPGRFLLERYTFGYVTSGALLLSPPGEHPKFKASGLLTLGGAEFGPAAKGVAPSRPAWEPLPGTEFEVAQVARQFATRFPKERHETLLGAEAGRGRLLRALDSGHHWRHLHLGTHAYFEEAPASIRRGGSQAAALGGVVGPAGARVVSAASRPGDDGAEAYSRNPLLACTLVLAGANRNDDGSSLSGEEIAGLDLRGCELAVLSACETGRGTQAGWQGVQGLQSGFHEAGARNVLASLWGVSDAATSVLMEEFYRQLWVSRRAPLEALREAQLAVLHGRGRVEQRHAELRQMLDQRSASLAALDRRGPGAKAEAGPAKGTPGQKSPVALWAAWVLSGPGR